jgi:L-alanine-DL-glutamate epimerase-like enolase superfamily enzyme
VLDTSLTWVAAFPASCIACALSLAQLLLAAAAAAAGVLDTSLTWVAGGITGSQAFAAWDRGFDVWLGTSRSNPPHAAAGETTCSSL